MKRPLRFLILLTAIRTEAVFVASNAPNERNSAPSGDRGWSYMAVYNWAGAVYLGNGWFITAAHLGTTRTVVKFDSIDHPIAGTSWRSVTNQNGTAADIRLFKVANPLAVPEAGARIKASSPGTGSPVTMIGYGRDVSSIATNQYMSKGLQTQVRYYEGTVSQMKWGTNTVSGAQASYTDPGYESNVFITTLFPGRAQALDKDSGGGVFVYDGGSGEYLLAGIMIGAVRYQDTNGFFAVTDTGDPGINSKTYCVNLAAYHEQIEAVVAIDDLDGDGLPDGWEYRYSGSPTGLVASADSDGDGFTNYQEYIADTNPTNAASFFEVNGVLAGASQTIYFTGSTGRQYQVLFTTNDLADPGPVWLAAHSNRVWGTGPGSSITVTNAQEKAFYRLRVTLP